MVEPEKRGVMVYLSVLYAHDKRTATLRVEKKAEIADFSTFFIKKCSCACVYAKKVVPVSRIMQFRRYSKRKYALKHKKRI